MEKYRRSSVHCALGGGAVADVILWRKWSLSAAFLVGSTALWFLFERAGYNLLSFMSNVLLLLIVILFFWAKSASILNSSLVAAMFSKLQESFYPLNRYRPLPPLPNLEISEETSVKAADEMRVWVNYALSIAHDIAIGGNWRIFLKVATVLWVISYIGSFFNFLTLIYIGILVSLSLPVLYDKYQNPIDDKLSVAYNIARIQYEKIDLVLQKIPLPSKKEKKTE